MTVSTVYHHVAQSIDGRTVSLEQFRGQVLLIVNTASACGFTPQLAGLQALHERFGAQGLVVLGFPCNQFGGQDPGGNDEIAAFCHDRYAVGFPLMAKVEVNGANAHPLFVQLRQQAPGVLGTQGIKWNFTKFLIGRGGEVLGRYAPATAPHKLESDIERALAA